MGEINCGENDSDLYKKSGLNDGKQKIPEYIPPITVDSKFDRNTQDMLSKLGVTFIMSSSSLSLQAGQDTNIYLSMSNGSPTKMDILNLTNNSIGIGKIIQSDPAGISIRFETKDGGFGVARVESKMMMQRLQGLNKIFQGNEWFTVNNFPNVADAYSKGLLSNDQVKTLQGYFDFKLRQKGEVLQSIQPGRDHGSGEPALLVNSTRNQFMPQNGLKPNIGYQPPQISQRLIAKFNTINW